MSEHSYEDFDEVLPEEPNGELVHWMEPRPLTFGPAGLALAVGGAFALGLATAMLAIGVTRMVGAEQRVGLPLGPRLRRLN
ncbi:MAG TPA: hypothetical protein VJS38_10145 [Phenylobacterium sp.]|uniref:hypothetical protein n=1 Tax=Phenylobacterium sp. TaxID=1871053 RepID=UPI002B46A630|nr:hypothetical protein [Phenylobacterium sp.]HKR88524.1 hypothetical protein [Phenylobacterium sp.]